MSAYLQKLKTEAEFKAVIISHKRLTIFIKKIHLHKCTKFAFAQYFLCRIAWIFMNRKENLFQFLSPFLCPTIFFLIHICSVDFLKLFL